MGFSIARSGTGDVFQGLAEEHIYIKMLSFIYFQPLFFVLIFPLKNHFDSPIHYDVYHCNPTHQ